MQAFTACRGAVRDRLCPRKGAIIKIVSESYSAKTHPTINNRRREWLQKLFAKFGIPAESLRSQYDQRNAGFSHFRTLGDSDTTEGTLITGRLALAAS